MVSRMTRGPVVPGHSGLVRASLEIFIRVSSRGRMMGKLRTAIKEKLLLAREAMAATMVRMEESPKLPRIRARINNPVLTTWFPISSRNIPKDSRERIAIRRRL